MPAGESEVLKPFNDFYTGFQMGLETTGLMMFIGLFLGLVFLLATGSIIYFKQLTEASADRDRYIVLHKVGVTKQEMKSYRKTSKLYLCDSVSNRYFTQLICTKRFIKYITI